MSDPQNNNSYKPNPVQKVYNLTEETDHVVELKMIYFGKKTSRYEWVNKELKHGAKKGEKIATIQAVQLKKLAAAKKKIQKFTIEPNHTKPLAAKEEVTMTWEQEVQAVEKDGPLKGLPAYDYNEVLKTKIGKKIFVVAVCTGKSGKITIEINENKLKYPESVYDNPVKLLKDDAEASKIKITVDGRSIYPVEIVLRPKTDMDLKALVTKYDKRDDRTAFLYCTGKLSDTEDEKKPEELTEYRNKDGERLEVLGTPCYCNRDIELNEMIDLIYHLRDKQNYKSERDAFFNHGGEYISVIRISDGLITDHKDKVKLFTDEINAMFKKFDIKKCKRKIHFIGQMYLETISFRYTYESRDTVPANYKGGVAFQGRGMKQITHDYNYLAYYDYINNTTMFDTYMQHRSGFEGVGECVEKRKLANKAGLDSAFYETLKTFAKNISEDLFHAFNSAGWFSTIYKPKTLAAMDEGLENSNVKKVTVAINGGDNNLTERENYTQWTRAFFKYDTDCINK